MNKRAAGRVYGLLQKILLPPAFRRRFGDDMSDLFLDQLRAARAHGAHTVALAWLRAVMGLAGTGVLERFERQGHPRKPPNGVGMLDTILQDLRFACRMLARQPASTLTAAVLLALGTGAVTTVFSAANAIILRPLAGARDTDRLVELQRTQETREGSWSASWPYVRHLQARTRTMAGIAGWTMTPMTLAGDGPGSVAVGNLVTANYFDVLGVEPALGRFFTPDEDSVPGARPVVVLADGAWRRLFGADPEIVGRRIAVNGHPYTVIGVAPRGFHGVFSVVRTDAWIPTMMQSEVRGGRAITDDPGAGWLEMFGRLAPGVQATAALDELHALTLAMQPREPASFASFTRVRLFPLTGMPADFSGPLRAFMVLLLAAAVLVLTIAGVNVAAMQLARAVSRRQEMAVRTALGAPRRRLIRQVLTESLLLCLAGCAGGVLLSFVGTHLLSRIELPVDVPIVLDLTPDARVLALALCTSLVAGVLFGLAPALQASQSGPAGQFRDDSAGSGSRHRFRNALVAGQLALTAVLLVSAGLFARALDRGRRVPPGFDPTGVATVSFNTETYGYDEARARVFYGALTTAAGALPHVQSLSFARLLPLTMNTSGFEIEIDGYDPGRGAAGVGVNAGIVDPGYFGVLRLPQLRGRDFTPEDRADAMPVAVVNEQFVRRLLGGADPLGRTFRLDGRTVTIVGVAGDSKYTRLSESPAPFVYLPLAQRFYAGRYLLIRGDGDPAALAAGLREVVRRLDPNLPVPDVVRLEKAAAISLLPQRVAAAATTAMGSAGLLLAIVGLYGVIAYSVSQRTREIGVRLALGADSGDVTAMIIRQGVRLAALGIGSGLVLCVVVTRALEPFLFGVSPLDAATVAGVTGLLAVVALVASWIPARRASRVPPMDALRS